MSFQKDLKPRSLMSARRSSIDAQEKGPEASTKTERSCANLAPKHFTMDIVTVNDFKAQLNRDGWGHPSRLDKMSFRPGIHQVHTLHHTYG